MKDHVVVVMSVRRALYPLNPHRAPPRSTYCLIRPEPQSVLTDALPGDFTPCGSQHERRWTGRILGCLATVHCSLLYEVCTYKLGSISGPRASLWLMAAWGVAFGNGRGLPLSGVTRRL